MNWFVKHNANFEKKIEYLILVKKTDFNTESTEVKNYIPSITVLATNAALKCVQLSGQQLTFEN